MKFYLIICGLLLIFSSVATAFWNVYGQRAIRTRPGYGARYGRYWYDDVRDIDDDYYNDRRYYYYR